MPMDNNTQFNRSMYLLASDRLHFLGSIVTPDQLTEGIETMGGGDHLSDYKTDEELIGAIRFMDWLIDHMQFARGMEEPRKPGRKPRR